MWLRDLQMQACLASVTIFVFGFSVVYPAVTLAFGLGNKDRES